jgi:uncharacterized protein (TIGR02145 family)
MKKSLLAPGIISALVFGVFISMPGCKKDNNVIITYGSMTDQDGYNYITVTINNQIWMAENLKTTHYRNGDSIPNITNDVEWANLTTDAYCNYNNDPDIAHIYGRLYNWFAVGDGRNIAPIGWHIPTVEEYTTLINYLGGYYEAGGKLKDTGNIHWNSPNVGATNESGFTALGGGYRLGNGGEFGWFTELHYSGNWWTSTTNSGSGQPYYLILYYGSDLAQSLTPNVKATGYSVRCIKDE